MSHLKNTFTSVGISKWVSWTGFKFYENSHFKFELANLLSTTGILVTQLSHAVQEGFGNKHWKQLNSAFSVSTKGHHFGFMFITSDLPSHVHGGVNASSSHLFWLSVWEWPLGLCLVSFNTLLSGQILNRNSNDIYINNYSMAFYCFVHSPGQLHQLCQWFGQK